MAEWGTSGAGQAFESVGADGANSTGTAVTSGGTNNVKGSWTELVAATARDATAILVELQALAAATAQLVDIGIGGAGSETVLIDNIPLVKRAGVGVSILFPVPIPAGTRLSARSQSLTNTQAIRVKALLLGRGFEAPPALGKVTAYGATTADSGGITVDPGGTANTEGAWVEISSSVSPIRWAVLHFNEVSALFGISIAQTWLVDLAVGAAAAEVEILSDLLVSGNPESDSFFPSVLLLPLHVASGSRLAVRARCSNNDASDRRLDVIIHGIA